MTDGARQERDAHVIARREVIRRAALVLGGTLSTSAIAAVLGGCGAPGDASHSAADAAGRATAWRPRALSTDQLEMVATIADHILPATDTPGARAAGVHQFIDTIVADYQVPNERARFLAGLAGVDARARREHGRAFLACDSAQQHAIVSALDHDAFAKAAGRPVGSDAGPVGSDAGKETERGGAGLPSAAPGTRPRTKDTPFMRTMKELTVLGYYTSEIGATKELRYERVPGRFDGCIPLTPADRTWAV